MTILSVMPNLYTADIERSVAFYRDVLGAKETFRTPADGLPSHVELRCGDVTIAVSTNEAVQEQGLPAPTGGHPMELVLWCDSTDDVVAAARTAGAAVLIEPNSGHVSGRRRAYITDPDGNWLAVTSRDAA
jgi:lactoylglutathione lyase